MAEMNRKSDPRNMSNFGGNAGVEAKDSSLLKPGAKDSIGSESNDMKPFNGSVDIGKMGPFGGENKY
jgi:hypothetical protein